MELLSVERNGETRHFVLGASFDESYHYVGFNISDNRVLSQLGFMYKKYHELEKELIELREKSGEF